MNATAELRVSGRVQGVGFRWWVAEQARALDLAGWVRNETDGSVRALFHGSREAVETMLSRCRNGPPHARVEKVDTNFDGIDPPAPYNGFTILR